MRGDVFSTVYILIFYSEITFFWWSVSCSLEALDSREDKLPASWFDEVDEIDFLGSKDCFVSELLALVVCAPSLSIKGEAVDFPNPNFLVEDALLFSPGLENLLKMPFF
jgi:hypothetical protein